MSIDWLQVARSLAAALASWQAQGAGLALAVYVACLFGACALGVPSPSLVEAAGAAVLGFWPALLASLPTAAVGALVPFAAARRWLGPWLERRFPRPTELMRRGVGLDGPAFLVTLRLMPGVPFAVTNLFIALTPMRMLTFFTINVLARAPMTILLCNAGMRLGRVRALGDLLAPGTLLAFAALAIFPLAARLAWRAWRRRAGAAPARARLDDTGL